MPYCSTRERPANDVCRVTADLVARCCRAGVCAPRGGMPHISQMAHDVQAEPYISRIDLSAENAVSVSLFLHERFPGTDVTSSNHGETVPYVCAEHSCPQPSAGMETDNFQFSLRDVKTQSLSAAASQSTRCWHQFPTAVRPFRHMGGPHCSGSCWPVVRICCPDLFHDVHWKMRNPLALTDCVK